MTDLEEKQEFFAKVMNAIVEAGYPDPGFYVDEYQGEPIIFSPDDRPVQSVVGDSPIGMLCDFVHYLDLINY